MQRYAGLCSPEQLQTLQKIFDVIWMEFRTKDIDNFSGSTDPEALRAEIARRVFDQFDGDDVNEKAITHLVLSSFGIQTNGTTNR